MQQTRVAQGTPYYLRFIENYPSVQDLAAAPQEDVLKLWQGLGYYSRARNLHATAQYIAIELDGKFPGNYRDLLKLKGVGSYTAAAIASFAYDLPHAVVDGNVYRVLSRIYGIETPIDTTAGQKEFQKLAQELLDPDRPSDHNQAIMEFGATQCAPKRPYCVLCPFNDRCVAQATGRIADLPVKQGKTKVRDRYLNYFVFGDDEKSILLERTGKGIWQGLYELPVLETETLVHDAQLLREHDDLPNLCEVVGLSVIRFRESDTSLLNKEPVIHKLSHQRLHATFWKVDAMPDKAMDMQELRKLPVPVLISNWAQKHWPNY